MQAEEAAKRAAKAAEDEARRKAEKEERQRRAAEYEEAEWVSGKQHTANCAVLLRCQAAALYPVALHLCRCLFSSLYS